MQVNKDRVCFVTGGTRGIGKAIALAFLAQGVRVAVNYFGDEASAAQMKHECSEFDDRFLLVRGDVSNWAEVEGGFQQIFDRFGSVDILINNAGIAMDRSFLKISNEDWNRVLAVNLTGPFYCCRMAVPKMIEAKWGRIINMSSVIGQAGNFGQTNYAASKAGLIGFTKALSRELAPKNITVNAIAPGFVNTSMTQGIPSAIRESITEKISIGRFGDTRDIVAAAAFLCADESSYLTGSVLNVDGGYHG